MKGLSARTGFSTTLVPTYLAIPVALMLPLTPVDSGGVPWPHVSHSDNASMRNVAPMRI